MAILSVHPWLFFLGKGCHIGRGGKISSKIWYMGVGLQSPNWISPLFPCFFIWRRGSWLIIGDNLFKGPGNFLRDPILLLFYVQSWQQWLHCFFVPISRGPPTLWVPLTSPGTTQNVAVLTGFQDLRINSLKLIEQMHT